MSAFGAARPGRRPSPSPLPPAQLLLHANSPPFAFPTDHGAPGILGMPSGPFLYADQLHAVLAARSRANGFKEMVV